MYTAHEKIAARRTLMDPKVGAVAELHAKAVVEDRPKPIRGTDFWLAEMIDQWDAEESAA
jgi:hypothetical protein